MEIKTTKLIDDGFSVFSAVSEFSHSGKFSETPWGIAAFVGSGEPQPMATGHIGGFFGVANGRTFSQIFPIKINSSVDNCKFCSNAQNIVSVFHELGGGFVSYGRNDLVPARRCPFGAVEKRRETVLSVVIGEKMFAPVLVDGVYISIKCASSIHSDYVGNKRFTVEKKQKSGTRADLKIGGCDLMKFGWSLNNDSTAIFSVIEEIFSDNTGIFATRIIPIARLDNEVAA